MGQCAGEGVCGEGERCEAVQTDTKIITGPNGEGAREGERAGKEGEREGERRKKGRERGGRKVGKEGGE